MQFDGVTDRRPGGPMLLLLLFMPVWFLNDNLNYNIVQFKLQ